MLPRDRASPHPQHTGRPQSSTSGGAVASALVLGSDEESSPFSRSGLNGEVAMAKR